MKIAIASDHAGYKLKETIRRQLMTDGHDVVDFGTDSTNSADYPDFIKPAALSVSKGRCDLGIVLGGSGNGEAMAANKVQGIRCAVCWNIDSARLAKRHNDANMISLGERMMTEQMALEIVDVWLRETFEGGRHINRINKIEKSYE